MFSLSRRAVSGLTAVRRGSCSETEKAVNGIVRSGLPCNTVRRSVLDFLKHIRLLRSESTRLGSIRTGYGVPT